MQRRLLLPAAVLSIAAISTAALAASQTKTGEIKSTDSSKHELVLSSGETFDVAKTIKIDKFKVGDKVTVTYATKDGKMVASKVITSK